MVGFSDFNTEIKDDYRGALPTAPTRQIAYIKHDSRDGKLKLLVPNPDAEDDDNAQNMLEFPLERVSEDGSQTFGEVELATLLMRTYLKADDARSQITEGKFFSLVSYGKEDSGHKGLMTRKEAYDRFGARQYYRLIGILRSINGKKPQTSVPALTNIFGEGGAVPALFDMPYSKWDELRKIDAGATNSTIVTIRGGKDMPYSVNVGGKTLTMYRPTFATKRMTKKQQQGMATLGATFLEEASNWMQQIDANDELVVQLYQHNIRTAGCLDALADVSPAITDGPSLNQWLKANNNDWNLLAQLAHGNSTTSVDPFSNESDGSNSAPDWNNAFNDSGQNDYQQNDNTANGDPTVSEKELPF